MVYGCDPHWWRHRKGLPEYKGLKVAWEGGRLEYRDILTVEVAAHRTGYSNEMEFQRVGKVGGGGNSGFQAVNLAAQLGAAKILLIGFDMTSSAGVHWYGRNNWHSANNPDETAFERWKKAFAGSVDILKRKGVEVINCSPQSALACFPKISLEAALEVDLDRLRA